MNYQSALFRMGLLVSILCLMAAACQQRAKSLAPVEFTALLKRFRNQGMGDTLLPAPVIYRCTFAEGKLQYELKLAAKPLRHEHARYLAYSDCEGEWDGTVYFFNKATHQVHRANATCANSVWQQGGQYWLLASLESAACATIADPEELLLTSTRRDSRVDWQYDFKLPEKGVKQVFDFYGVKLFGGFLWQNQTLYLMYWRNTTFLVTINGKQITIVDPLFANDLFTHNPVISGYKPDLALTNLDFYALGDNDEVATLLWQGQ